MTTRVLESLIQELLGASIPFVSPGAVELEGPELGFRAGSLVRDPDGHPLLLVEGAKP
jgi:hypothetical protein